MQQIKNNPPTLLQFPCSFPIKIMGINDEHLLPEVTAIIARHVSDFNPQSDIEIKISSKKNYVAITVTIMAISKQQLDIIYSELHKHNLVKVIL